MEGMRAILNRELARSLEAVRDDDLFATAWPVACGTVLARRGEVVRYQEGIVHVLVRDAAWAQQMRSMSQVLQRELATITGKTVTGIHFEVPGPTRI
jgi:predicted nucleic acid-binding Zn ribbon protein